MKRVIEVLDAGIINDSGLAVSNGTVTFYDAGTTALRTVYQDFALTTAHANPATLSSVGRLLAYTDQRVKLVIRESSGSIVRTVDNVGTADSDLSAATSSTLAGAGLVPNGSTIDVNPDGSTLEVIGDQVRVKDLGITTAKLADNAVTIAKSGFIVGSDELDNITVAASVAANALTISLKTRAGTDPSAADPVTIAFRSATLTSGLYNYRTITAPLSMVVSSGSTLGHFNGVDAPIYIYAIDNAGSVELAVSSSAIDERFRQSTTAEGGAGAADAANVIYSTTARSSLPTRLICIFKSNQATAGTWAVIPISISNPSQSHPIGYAVLRPGISTAGVAGVGYSSGSGVFGTSSAAFVAVTNLSISLTTTGRPVCVGLIGTGGGLLSLLQNNNLASGGQIRFLRDGVTEIYKGELWSQGGAVRSPACPMTLDFIPAATYLYTVQARDFDGSQTFTVSNMRLIAYEI